MTQPDIMALVEELDSWHEHDQEKEAVTVILTIIMGDESIGFSGDRLSAATNIPRSRVQDYLRRLRANGIIVGKTSSRQMCFCPESLEQDDVAHMEVLLMAMAATGTVVTDRYKPLAKQTPTPRVKVLDKSHPEKTQVEPEPDPPPAPPSKWMHDSKPCGHTRPWLTCKTCQEGEKT